MMSRGTATTIPHPHTNIPPKACLNALLSLPTLCMGKPVARSRSRLPPNHGLRVLAGDRHKARPPLPNTSGQDPTSKASTSFPAATAT